MLKTKFYTGQGDKGTSKMGKCEISKDDVIFQLLGSLDELNSWVGFCRAGAIKIGRLKVMAGWLREVQESLFIIQAEAAALGSGFKPKFKIAGAKTMRLEKIIKEIDKKLPPLTKFIIPGASEASAQLDVARVLARKTERSAKMLSADVKLSPGLLQYLNRLSSFLFAIARWTSYLLKIKEEHPSYK